ncbi:hypothetical protein [Saccharothrix syringae]|uniref:Uncharacterized protein n=1 Tax=Saccharothrix syringae TaxID=103733 RepID=A0A5Q0GT35_SACSY|nr:hypothetical protein [Saccharothrix syringae]QFZ17217.1 hypothetical protein EKG83_06825 [Saccharothrix syringae]
MGESDERFGPGGDTPEDRPGPNDEQWPRTRPGHRFDRDGVPVGAGTAGGAGADRPVRRALPRGRGGATAPGALPVGCRA